MPACKSWLKYSWEGRQCENPAWEGDPEGMCLLHSLRPDKDEHLFDQALREKLDRADFDFREVFFPGPVAFTRQAFTKPANFHGAKFTGWADFRAAEFQVGADFSYAKFSQDAIFAKAGFKSETQFIRTTIAGEADFRGAVFEAGVLFHHLNEPSGNLETPPCQAFFQHVDLGAHGRLRFQDLSLERVSFLGTDMRRLEFHNVRWPSRHGRQVLYDELLLNDKGGPAFLSLQPDLEYGLSYEDICARLEKLYRYLKLNYEQEGDQKQAGDFHYGEMEMHRRSQPWRRRFPLSWYNLYWALSGYGERPLRALVWALGLLSGLSLLLYLVGLKTPEGNRLGFGSTIIYLLQQATLLRPQWAAPATSGGQLLTSLSRIFLPGQAALFILALRNRLGRRR